MPISDKLEENKLFANCPDCSNILEMTMGFYENIGYNPPWIGYFVRLEDRFVGTGAFKGIPVNNKVELAYSTFEWWRNQGIGKRICRELIDLARNHDSKLIISARTLPEKNFSTRILEENCFEWAGSILDEEDGEVWEWIYREPSE